MFAADTCRGGVEHAATAIGHICRHVVDAPGTTGRQMNVRHRFTLLSLHAIQLIWTTASANLLCSLIEAVQKAVCNQSATVTSEESLENSSLFTNAQPPIGPEWRKLEGRNGLV